MITKPISQHRNETMVETITFVGSYRGMVRNGFRPSTVRQLWALNFRRCLGTHFPGQPISGSQEGDAL